MNDDQSRPALDYLNELAEREGLCPNCFHTLECCAGKCPLLDDMEHDCEASAH